MARPLSAIFDDLIANLIELKAALSPFALIGAAVVSEARKPGQAKRRATATASKPKRRISPKTRAAMQQQGLYLASLNRLKPAQRAKVKKARTSNGLPAALALARKLAD